VFKNSDFILSTIHQLKESAVSIKWSLRMFLSGDFGKITKEQKDVFEKLYNKNEAQIYLIDDLLNTIKIEEGMYAYNKTLFDAEESLEQAISYFEDKIKSKEITIKFEKSHQKLPKIKADKGKIEMVMHNLINNALKYTGAGGTIKIFLEDSGKELKFHIEDSGIGIPKSQQDKVFSKFFRADKTHFAEGGGFGLGLFLAKKIVEDHGGKIWFESKDGKGSSFCFTLPWNNVK